MSTNGTENKNVIDEKKTQGSGVSAPNFKEFMMNYLSSIFITIGFVVFIVGSAGLFTTKVAQANILPDNPDMAPYTVFDRVLKEDIPIDINIMRPSFWSDNKDTFSQKAVFQSQEYLDSFQNSFLCSLKKSASVKSGLFANAPLFFSNVYDNIVAKNFSAINNVFLWLSYLPESLVMIVYGFFGVFIWVGLYFFNVCISIFYHFINIPQLFRDVHDSGDKWESEEDISFFRITKLILFFCLWIPVGFLSLFCGPVFCTMYGLISPLFASYKVEGKKKPSGIFHFIKDTFAYKKYFFIILATVSLLSNGTKYLGSQSIIGIIIAIGFAYLMGLYNNEMPSQDGFTAKIREDVKQAVVKNIQVSSPNLVKICQPIDVHDERLMTKISQGKWRPITTSDGGATQQLSKTLASDMPSSEPLSSEPLASEPLASDMPSSESKEALIGQLNDLLDQYNEAVQDLDQSFSSQDEYASILNEIQDVKDKLNKLETGQMGGKKTHKKNYNIRLV